MFRNSFRSLFVDVPRRIFKVSVAGLAALLIGGSLGSALGLIKVQAFVLIGAIFCIFLAVLSKSLQRKHRAVAAAFVSVLAIVSMKLTTFPGLAHLEDVTLQEVDRRADHLAQKIQMPHPVDCADPFVDPQGKPLKFFRVDTQQGVKCYDRAGTVGGEDLQPITKEVARLIVHTSAAPTPPNLHPKAPAPQPPTVQKPETSRSVPAHIEAPPQEQPRDTSTQQEVLVARRAVHSCDQDVRFRSICNKLLESK